MSRSAKLDMDKARKGAAEDHRAFAHKADDFLMEIREYLQQEKQTVSRDSLIARIDHFLLTQELLPQPN